MKTNGRTIPSTRSKDLHELLRQLDAVPAYVGGASSGCRMALVFALRHPQSAKGLLLWRVTGTEAAAQRLAKRYYTDPIEPRSSAPS